MKVYVENNPETISSGRVKDEIKTTEIRMWFETDEEIEVLPLADYTKQVRKEVCEEIREICKLNIRTYKIQSQDDCERYKEIDAFNKAIFGVLEILDQIEQGKQND